MLLYQWATSLHPWQVERDASVCVCVSVCMPLCMLHQWATSLHLWQAERDASVCVCVCVCACTNCVCVTLYVCNVVIFVEELGGRVF